MAQITNTPTFAVALLKRRVYARVPETSSPSYGELPNNFGQQFDGHFRGLVSLLPCAISVFIGRRTGNTEEANWTGPAPSRIW